MSSTGHGQQSSVNASFTNGSYLVQMIYIIIILPLKLRKKRKFKFDVDVSLGFLWNNLIIKREI